ncbi:hypothetical protein OMP43_21760 [Sphingomonas sp. CBMAI 2297]|uniref:hypothetical protein n=1 Tax=Sphingomonas sp. CBMAI 2297 TaxID=2991720 RepID=UPI002456C028|nr:hypothetical protein [Sphingomonas sp. CBMAI 2297]MDH4746657.1 hypothetical protein [Sphingomonas sp. CBMAI 2297]
MARSCSDCGRPISRNSKGRCRACGAASLLLDPVVEARRLERLREKLSSPDHAAKMSVVRKAHEAEALKDPAYREMRRQHGLQVRQRFLDTPGAEERRRAAQAQAMRERAAEMFAWCPADRLDEYQRLRKAFGAAEARRIIEDDTPGTEVHGKREVANHMLAGQLRHERQQREAY